MVLPVCRVLSAEMADKVEGNFKSKIDNIEKSKKRINLKNGEVDKVSALLKSQKCKLAYSEENFIICRLSDNSFQVYNSKSELLRDYKKQILKCDMIDFQFNKLLCYRDITGIDSSKKNYELISVINSSGGSELSCLPRADFKQQREQLNGQHSSGRY